MNGSNVVVTKNFTVGDRRTPIADTLERLLDDGVTTAPVDLTGCTVAFKMIAEDGTVKVNSAAAVIDDEDNGEVSYLWQAADVDTEGLFYYWWIVTQSGKTEHYPADGRKRIARFHAAA